MTIDELSKEFNVSTKTISRWRRQGLDGQQFVLGGHRRVGFWQSAVERFVNEHPDLVRRAAQFSQLTDNQRQGIFAEARRLAEAGERPSDLIRRLARETSRSVETIRYTLKQFDREHPKMAVLKGGGQFGDQRQREIYQHYRLGESIEALAKRYQCSHSAVSRAVARIRYRHVSRLPLDYIPNEQFERASSDEERAILGPPPPATSPPRKARRPSGLPPYLASLYEVPLLTREQEAHLFRKMNFLKYKAGKALRSIDSVRPGMAAMDEVERFHQQSVAVKNEIMRANLRLVVSIAKRYASRSQTMFDLVSDGNMSLMRAVEKFDFGRGFKFSTYATWAIVKNFARSLPNEQRRQSRFRTGRDEMFTATRDERADLRAEESEQAQREAQVARMLEHLDDREREIVSSRYGLNRGREPMTLKEVGAAMGVTKERIRQLESRALEKLREAARAEGVALAEDEA